MTPALPRKLSDGTKSYMRNCFLENLVLITFKRRTKLEKNKHGHRFPDLYTHPSQFALTLGSSFSEIIINASGFYFSLPGLGPDFQRTKNFLKIRS